MGMAAIAKNQMGNKNKAITENKAERTVREDRQEPIQPTLSACQEAEEKRGFRHV